MSVSKEILIIKCKYLQNCWKVIKHFFLILYIIFITAAVSSYKFVFKRELNL